jgi:phage protein D
MPAPDNPHAIIEIGGDRYDSWRDKQLFRQVTVELASNMASEGLFRFFDPRFRIIDKYTGDDGVAEMEVKFYMGFGLDLGPPVFTGLLEVTERGDSDTTFIAYDKGYKMRRVKDSEYHRGLHDVQIITKLATRNGLKVVGPDDLSELEPHPSMIQDSQNDWEHSMERAREAGYVLYVRGDTLFIKEPAKVGAPVLTLRNRKDFWLLHNWDFKYKLPENNQGRHKHVEWRSRNHGGKRLTGNSSTHKRGHQLRESRHDISEHSKPTANRRARAAKELQREHAFVLDVRSIPPLPSTRPDVRDTIALEGVGLLFSGPYLCDKVVHDLTGGGFGTQYSLYRDTRNG